MIAFTAPRDAFAYRPDELHRLIQQVAALAAVNAFQVAHLASQLRREHKNARRRQSEITAYTIKDQAVIEATHLAPQLFRVEDDRSAGGMVTVHCIGRGKIHFLRRKVHLLGPCEGRNELLQAASC